MKAVFDHTQPEAANITTFFFKPEKPVHYTAGQFTELHIPDEHHDNRGTKRWFTLSSSPNDDFLTITTKFAKERSSSFKKKLFGLKPGTIVDLAEPMGDFVLPKLIQTPLIFVAGGIGVTPFHSMFRWLAQTNEQRPIRFIYGVTSEDEIIFQETFEAAKQHATIVVGKPSPAWGGERGQIDADLVLGLEQPSEDTLIYISGPEEMVEALQKDLRAKGVKKEQLVGDFFPGYGHI